MSTADALLDRLDGVVSRGASQWSARCPAHEDRDPSLSVRETEDGWVLLHCFAGCETGDVLAAVGLQFSDLYPDSPIDDNAQQRRPRMNGWAAVNAVSYSLTCITLLANKLRECPLNERDQRTLDESIQVIQAAVAEARRVR
jgi:hypothetical protein